MAFAVDFIVTEKNKDMVGLVIDQLTRYGYTTSINMVASDNEKELKNKLMTYNNVDYEVIPTEQAKFYEEISIVHDRCADEPKTMSMCLTGGNRFVLANEEKVAVQLKRAYRGIVNIANILLVDNLDTDVDTSMADKVIEYSSDEDMYNILIHVMETEKELRK